MASILFLLLLFSRFPVGNNFVKTINKIKVERGRSVTIPCHYDQKHKDHVKCWCKGETWESCSVTKCSDSPQSEGEVSITDVPDLLLFTVTVRNLQQKDSDWYWCGVEIDGVKDEAEYLTIEVTADIKGVRTENWVSAERGGSVTIPCQYDQKYNYNVKYWCKGETPSSCSPVVRSDSQQSEGEVSITDVPDQLLFTVTMRNLQQNDSGWYWCGVKNDDAEDEYAYLYLTVTTGVMGVMTENWVSAETGGSVNISCRYEHKYKDHVKYWCRGFTWSPCSPVVRSDSPHSEGEVSITDVPHQLLFTVTMRNLQQNDSGWYWCGVKNDDAEDEYAYLYLTVTTGTGASPTENTVRLTSSENHSAKETDPTSDVVPSPTTLLIILVSAGLLVLLLVPFVIKIWILRKKRKEMKADSRPTLTENEQELTYSSFDHAKPAGQRRINQPLTLPGDEVVYSAVAV